MKSTSKTVIFYRVMFFVTLALAAAFLTFIILGVVIPHLYGDSQILMVTLFAIGALLASSIVALSLHNLREEKRFITQLETENLYTFGKATQFYNLEAFKNRVRKLSRKNKNENRFLMCFTPTALDLSANRMRNPIVMDLNCRLAEFFDRLFKVEKNEFNQRDTVYGFSRGIFLIYCISNDDTYIHRLLNVISNECFRMVNEEKIKIWVQPFYGINRITRDASITRAIEDTLIARDISEKNIESFTYFRESFRKEEGNVSSEISDALEKNQFIPYYQGKYSLKEHRFISAEVLARWKHPELGILGPGKFIEKAEKAGLLNAIDLKIFELAVKDLSENLKRGRRTLPISVNFSLYEFFSKKFINVIMDTLKKYQVPPTLLEIEITETTSQVNKFLSLSVIRKLKEYGIRVLMDDFGVGYSQIENLRQIPFDAVKIDKSFSDRLLTDEKTRAITKFLIELCHINDMEVIIEGVENKEQVDILRKYKADTIQGFYYSKPISFEDFNLMLRSNPFEKGEK